MGRRIYAKKQKAWIGYAYPFLATLGTLVCLVSINQFLIFGVPFVSMYTKNAELVMLCVNFGVSIFLVLKYAKYAKPVDMKKDGLMFWMPVFFHVYALVTCIVMGISKAIPTVIV